MEKIRTERAFSAGGVVLRDGPRGREVILVGQNEPAIWGLPKGGPSPGENLEQTALRETTEETGLETRIVDPLGAIDYWFRAGGRLIHKTVHYYLMVAVGGDMSSHDAEHDRVEWVTLDDAYRLMSFKNERSIVLQAAELWRHRSLASGRESENR